MVKFRVIVHPTVGLCPIGAMVNRGVNGAPIGWAINPDDPNIQAFAAAVAAGASMTFAPPPPATGVTDALAAHLSASASVQGKRTRDAGDSADDETPGAQRAKLGGDDDPAAAADSSYVRSSAPPSAQAPLGIDALAGAARVSLHTGGLKPRCVAHAARASSRVREMRSVCTRAYASLSILPSAAACNSSIFKRARCCARGPP